MVVLGWRLDLMILEIFSNLNDSMIYPSGFPACILSHLDGFHACFWSFAPCSHAYCFAFLSQVFLSQIAPGSAPVPAGPQPCTPSLHSAPPRRSQGPPAKSLGWHRAFLAVASQKHSARHAWAAADKRCEFRKDLFTASCTLTPGFLAVNPGLC